MKTVTQIRNMAAVAAVVFTAILSGCQKNEIAPVTPPSGNTPPVVAQPPAAVSMKPKSITTLENGSTVRSQLYEYDVQGKLVRYSSKRGNLVDSVLVRSNNVSFKASTSNNNLASLVFNADKTFKALFTSTDQIDFVNNQTKLSRMTRLAANNTTVTAGVFSYTNNNLSSMGAEIRVDINYHDNLPYQKGINEIPTVFKPLGFYKVMEQEEVTSTLLYNKLIRQVIIGFGSSNTETHEFTYSFDSNNRVTGIRDVITNTTSTSSVQKIHISTITY